MSMTVAVSYESGDEYELQYLMRVAMSMRVAVSYESGDEYDSCSIL